MKNSALALTRQPQRRNKEFLGCFFHRDAMKTVPSERHEWLCSGADAPTAEME
jgi:hypothetical protein